MSRSIRLCTRAALALFLSDALTEVPARAATPPPGFEDALVVGVDETGAATPVGIAFEPGTGAMFILEKGDGAFVGSARVRRRDATTGVVTTALTIPCMDSSGERGLLGLAFDPDYLEPGGDSRWVYLYYSRYVGQAGTTCDVSGTPKGVYNRVSRFREVGGILTAEEILLQGPSLDANNHQGGAIRFGIDKTLFVAMGDNDTDAYPVPAARDLSDLRGKILRIARDGSIPPDNPFVGQAGVRPEIWAYGLRNPFRISVDEEVGTLFIGDVGEARWEEIDAGIAGADYGWPCFEARSPFATCDPPPVADVKPVYAYGHNGQTPPVEGDSVICGPVYHAAAFPEDYRHSIFFGDYGGNWIRRAHVAPDGSLENVEPFILDAVTPVDFAITPAGCLAWVSIVEGVHETCYVGGDNGQPHAVATATPVSGLAPLAVQFDGTASSDPDQDPLTYSWSFGDATSSTAPAPLKTYSTNGVRQAALTVDDGSGEPNSSDAAPPIRIVVGNRAPTGAIVAPSAGTTYDAGDTIDFSGTATDPEDGVLPPSGYSWNIVFHHADHTHPFLGPITGTTSGSFTIPTTGEDATDVFFRISLDVTDSGSPLGVTGALTQRSWVDLHPNVTSLRAETVPPGAGLQMGIDHRFETAPCVEDSVVAFPRTLTAESPQTASGASWEFVSWSDGGDWEHVVAAPPTPTTYTATYRCTSGCDFNPVVTGTRLPEGGVRWEWTAPPCARRFDVVRGSLATLRSSGGNFATSTTSCVANDLADTSVVESTPPFGGAWFLVSAVGCLGEGTFDEQGIVSQKGSRDAEIGAAARSCANGSEYTPTLVLSRTGPDAVVLSWSALTCATSYDVTRGSLEALRTSGGDFAFATSGCTANDLAGTSTEDATPTPSGGGVFYLARGAGCGSVAGTYDEDGLLGQIASRDAKIAASMSACP